jgi:hypothetical protein
MTHSPLPWTKKSEFTGYWYLRDANDETIVLVAQTKQIAEPHTDPEIKLTRTVSLPHATADAALFFAAPRLLAAAKALVEYCDLTRDLQGEYVDALRAAIAEAETP